MTFLTSTLISHYILRICVALQEVKGSLAQNYCYSYIVAMDIKWRHGYILSMVVCMHGLATSW